jgi:hypothetical protein
MIVNSVGGLPLRNISIMSILNIVAVARKQ